MPHPSPSSRCRLDIMAVQNPFAGQQPRKLRLSERQAETRHVAQCAAWPRGQAPTGPCRLIKPPMYASCPLPPPPRPAPSTSTPSCRCLLLASGGTQWRVGRREVPPKTVVLHQAAQVMKLQLLSRKTVYRTPTPGHPFPVQTRPPQAGVLGRFFQRIRVRTVRASTSGAWTPKRDAHVCMQAGCRAKFGLTLHRHHCRRCGAVVCDACSRTRVALPQLSPRPQRVCSGCMARLVELEGTELSVVSLPEPAVPAPLTGPPRAQAPSLAPSEQEPASESLAGAGREDSDRPGSVDRGLELQARSAFAAEVASSVVAGLLSLARRVPLVGPCADVLRDIFAMHEVQWADPYVRACCCCCCCCMNSELPESSSAEKCASGLHWHTSPVDNLNLASHGQVVKAHKEAVAGFTLRIQQLAGMWVRLLGALDCAETRTNPCSSCLLHTEDRDPAPHADATPSVSVPTLASPVGPDWLPAFHVLLQESSDAIKVCTKH
jgi:hypothetical protein